MQYGFFRISAMQPETGQSQLNRFLAESAVLSVEKCFVTDGQSSYWSVVVCYTESADKPPVRGRVDYREILSPADFAVFAELRKLRKEIADAEAIPPYAVFNNEQLAELVSRRVATPAAVGEIDGIGPARVEKYAGRFLARIAELQSASGFEQ